MLSMDGEAAGGLLVRQVGVELDDLCILTSISVIIICLYPNLQRVEPTKHDLCQKSYCWIQFAGVPGAQYGIFAHY